MSEYVTENGRKDTEIGTIPAEWDVVKLQNAANITMGQSPPSSTYNEEGIGLPFLQGKAEFGPVYPKPVKFCSEPKKTAAPHSILISVRAPVGDVNLALEKYAIGRGLSVIDAKENADNKFLFYFLQWAKERLEEQGTGSTFKSINKNVLENFLIPLPGLEEQQRIAAVLTTIQQAIAAQEQVIQAAQGVKRSLMHRLFTYGPYAEPHPTKETEIGDIPEHWELIPLGELTKSGFQNGLYKHGSFYGSGTPILRVDMFDEGDILKETHKFKKLQLTEDELMKYSLAQGDLIINRVNGNPKILGKCALVGKLDQPMVFESNMIKITVNTNRISSLFLMRFLSSPLGRRQILQKARVVHQASINQQDLKTVLVALPEDYDQEKIATALTASEEKINFESNRKNTLETLFRSLLHQLMTGQIRILPLETMP